MDDVVDDTRNIITPFTAQVLRIQILYSILYYYAVISMQGSLFITLFIDSGRAPLTFNRREGAQKIV